jgi:hypothetical protein
MSADDWAMLLNLLALSVAAGSVGHIIGARRGALREREHVNHGMGIALSILSSKALYLMNGWNRGNITEAELLAGLKEYAAEKKAKHDAQEQAFYERLQRHNEKERE